MIKTLKSQKGAFSPFMFGLLMGAAVFSAAMNHWAKRELVNVNERQVQINRDKAIDIKNALENSMITENINSDNQYSEDFTLERAQRFLSGSTGKSRSGDDALLSAAHRSGAFKTNNKRILITTTDDQATRAEVGELAGSEAMGQYNKADSDVVMFDSETVRLEQIKKSKIELEKEASQIFRSYATYGYKFPTTEQYNNQVSAATNHKDVWGQSFKYERRSDKVVILSFTSPWGFTYKKRLDMN